MKETMCCSGCRRFPSPSLRVFRARPIFPSPFPFLPPAKQAIHFSELWSVYGEAQGVDPEVLSFGDVNPRFPARERFKRTVDFMAEG